MITKYDIEGMLDNTQLYQLEELIDANGVSRVLEGIAEICLAKSDHARTNWQDEVLARRWSVACSHVEKLSYRLRHIVE